MEEGSEAHMETDVSSTTDDAIDTQEVTGSNGQVEMTITVEKVDEGEATSNMEVDTQLEKSHNNPSPSTLEEKSPHKKPPSPSIDLKSQNKSNDVSEAIQKSPPKTELPQKVTITRIVPPVKLIVQTSSTNLSGSADSSTKIDSLSSPSKDKSLPIEKASNKDQVNITSAVGTTKLGDNIKISPVKEIIAQKSPAKHLEGQRTQQPCVSDSKSPSKGRVERSPTMNPEQKLSRVTLKSPTKTSSPVKLVRRLPKELTLKDTTLVEIQSQDSTKPTSQGKPISDTLDKEVLDISPKPSQNVTEVNSSKKLVQNQPASTEVLNSTDNVSKCTEVSNSTVILKNNEVTKSTELSKNTDNLKGQTQNPVEVTVMEAEASNDSQLSSTASDKEHNKSISRELKSLIKSAKESKIISECTQLTSKTRKSRTNLDTSLNMSEAEIPNDKKDMQVSESSDKTKRSMRSQNPDFVTKCKQFLNSVTSKVIKDSDLETMSEDETDSGKQKQKTSSKTAQLDVTEPAQKRKKIEAGASARLNKLRSDPYCWKCHWALEEEGDEKTMVLPSLHCTVCVRSYHLKCLTTAERKITPEKNWVCPDCLLILHAESSESRSPAMKKISLGMLCDLLKFALERMMALNGVEPFLNPVDRTEFPDYDKVIVHPMDLSLMKKNIADGHYGSTEAFIADAQWILHNSILFNASHSKLTAAARALVRTCRAEMGEIETCPECYAGAHSRKLTFFTEVCSTPHMLLWAKLKGFPYWPAKAMAVNPSKEGMVVDVRFFGDHDRAWLNVKDCFLYSEKDPNTVKNKKHELLLSRQEAEVHIRNICRKYGSFVYAPFRIPFDPTQMTDQLKLMIPSFEGEIKMCKDLPKPSPVGKDSRRSTSKSSKSSFNDGETSECEESSTKAKVTEGAEMCEDPAIDETKERRDNPEADSKSNEKDKTMEVDEPKVVEILQKEEKTSRKRRRSSLPEGSETAPKKKKIEEKPEQKPEKKKTLEKKTEEKKEEPSKEDKKEIIKNHEDEVAKLTKETDEKSMNEIQQSSKLLEEREALRVTPIKLVALPRANKQTPKIFTTAKVSKSPSQSSASTSSTPTTPSIDTPTAKDDDSIKEKRIRSKVTKADRDIMSKEITNEKLRTNRRNSKNKSLTTTPKQEKTDKSDKKPDTKTDSGSDASTSKEKSKKKDESDRSLLKKTDTPKALRDEKDKDKKTEKKSIEDDVSLAVIARETRYSSSGLPTISNVCSLSTTAQNTSTRNTKVTTTSIITSAKVSVHTHVPKSVEVTIEANPTSSIFTPTSTNNVGNMKEAVSKLQKLRNDTEQPFVGRVGVKAFARMTSPDINDSVQVEIKPEPIDLDEIDEERQMEKMDLMNACKLQPVNQQPTTLRDVRINKVVVTPSVVVKKKPEPRPRAKKTFPQPRRPEDGRSELNGKNSMVYIPIQPPMTQAPMRAVRPVGSGHGITMPANVTAGPRMSAPVTSANNTVNTVTTPLLASAVGAIRTLNANLSSPPPLTAASNSGPMVATVPTVGPTAVHTVPLMTSVNGQWMFSLQPVMSVGGVNASPSPPMVNGISDRPATSLVPISTSSAAPVITPVPNRTANANQAKDNGTPGEMPRLQQRPLLNPLDPETPIGSVPIPSTAGPITAKLNQNAVKLTDFFRTLVEDCIEKVDEPLAQVNVLKLQLEQARWRNQQTIDELKHNHELTVSELRSSFEKEKLRIISETRRAAQEEVTAAVKLTKMKQWCSNCFQEAQFYCCWNTSYCDHACQRAHWNVHHSKCTQERAFQSLEEEPLQPEQPTLMKNPNLRDDKRQNPRQPQIIIQNHRVKEMERRRREKILDANSTDNDTPESRLKQSDNPPKSVPSQTPPLTVGGKIAPARVYTDASGTHKTSIIVSMVEDGSGNQTIKCLGTYKPPTQATPLVINKQKANDDSGAAAKKVVTSGGYLIVGSDNTTSVITPASASRRPQIYYT